MSAREIRLVLTTRQVAQLRADTGAGEGDLFVLMGVEKPREVIDSPLLEDPKISKSLLLGLMVLVSFPADGAERGNKEVAQELGLAASTTHRYIHSLVAAGLLERNPVTRQYRRPVTSGQDRRGRRRG